MDNEDNEFNEKNLSLVPPAQSGETADETHLRELKTGGTILHWIREIHKLLRSERKSKVDSQFGSDSDYIEHLIATSADPIAARLNFKEAFDQVLLETSLSNCSPFQIEVILALIMTFKPPQGFSLLASYLLKGGVFESRYLPKTGRRVPTDLHENALVALRVFYRVAPPDASALAFRTYVGILRIHLHRPRYCGFAAKELINLELLRPGTAEMRTVLRENLNSLEILIPFLISEERRLYSNDDLKNLVVDCVTIESSEPFKKFTEVLQKSGATLRYADQFPGNAEFSEKNIPFGFNFADGTVYTFALSESESETFATYMCEISQEDLTKTVQLITNDDYSPEQKTDGLSVYFYRSVGLGNEAVNSFVENLNKIEAKVIAGEAEKVLIKRKDSMIPLHYEREPVEKFRMWELMNLESNGRLDQAAIEHEQYFNKTAGHLY